MLTPERLLHELDKRQLEIATAAMHMPPGDPRVARQQGIYLGLEEVRTIINQLLSEDDEKEKVENESTIGRRLPYG